MRIRIPLERFLQSLTQSDADFDFEGRGTPAAVFSELREEYRLADYAQSLLVPVPPDRPDDLTNATLTRLGSTGIDLNVDQQLALLDSWRAKEYQDLFEELRNTQQLKILTNGLYQTPDAEVYASMILSRKPRRVVEVGSGFSTLVARMAIRHGGLSTRLVAIDPQPRTDVKAAVDELILSPVERSGLLDYDWSPDDILFIDSSHACRTRGDLPYLYCQVLPSLPAGMLVHVHDIFLPYDYPNVYDAFCYTELYLLYCLLAHSPRYRVVFATHMLSREHRDRMRSVIGQVVATETPADYFGSSFWFEIRP